MLALHPYVPRRDCFRWEGVWCFCDDGVVFKCYDTFDGGFGRRGWGPICNYSSVSAPESTTYAPSRALPPHQHSDRTHQNVTTMPLFSPLAGFRMSTSTQSFFVVRSASPFSSGNMDAPVTVMHVTPCVCQNASMGRYVATDMKTWMDGRNERGRRRKSGREKRGGKSRATKLERREEKAEGLWGIGDGIEVPIMIDQWVRRIRI